MRVRRLVDAGWSREAAREEALRQFGDLNTVRDSCVAMDQQRERSMRFVREQALDDGATRVVNPQPGLVRFAAIAPAGFAEGRVYTLRFSVVRSSGLRSFQLSTDEAHSVTQANLVPVLSRKPCP